MFLGDRQDTYILGFVDVLDRKNVISECGVGYKNPTDGIWDASEFMKSPYHVICCHAKDQGIYLVGAELLRAV